MRLRPPRPLFILLLAAACAPSRSPFARVTSEDGRVYYARMDIAFHSEAGGFLAFRDLVTKESVRLKNGTYTALECPPEEVEVRQREFIDDPTRIPMASDYETEPR
jgi:hypothetical protein